MTYTRLATIAVSHPTSALYKQVRFLRLLKRSSLEVSLGSCMPYPRRYVAGLSGQLRSMLLHQCSGL